MRWNTYKKLSPKLQKEYDYRFKQVPVPNPNKYITWAFGLLLMMTLIMLTSFVILSDDTFLEIREETISLVSGANNLATAISAILISFAIYDAIVLMIYYINRKRWIRKNKIKGEVIWEKIPFIRIL